MAIETEHAGCGTGAGPTSGTEASPRPGVPDVAREELPNLIAHCIRRYYQKDFGPMLDRLSDDCVWIGAGNMLYFGRAELVEGLKGELDSPDCTVRNADFRLLETGHDDEALVLGLYDVYTDTDERVLCAVHQRLSALCRLVDGRWLCYHLHSSNEWNELGENELFPVETGKQTYLYVQRIIKTAEDNGMAKRRVELRFAGRTHFVDPDDILYVEAASKESVLHLAGDTQRMNLPLGQVERLLPDGFVRIHRSYIVNADRVARLDGKTLALSDGTVLPVATKRRDAVRERIRSRLTGPTGAGRKG